jgi:hypothetical protein
MVVASPTSISCTTPAESLGNKEVRVTVGVYSDYSTGLTYISSPSISGVSPPSGSSSGGTTVTITGSDFHSGASVAIGGATCTLVDSPSIDSMTCITGNRSTGDRLFLITFAM